MGSSCSNLASTENFCELEACVQSVSPSNDSNVWLLQLQEGTHYNGTALQTVMLYMSLFPSTQDARYNQFVRLVSMVQRVVQIQVCPFFEQVLHVGYNCDLVNMLHYNPVANQEQRVFLLTHQAAGEKASPWMNSHALEDRRLVLFQLVYTCYVLELAGFSSFMDLNNLTVLDLGKEEPFYLHTNTTPAAFYLFYSRYKLQVVNMPLLVSATTTLFPTLLNLFFQNRVPFSTSTALEALQGLGEWLRLQGVVSLQYGVPASGLKHVYSVQPSYFVNQIVKPVSMLNPLLPHVQRLQVNALEIQEHISRMEKFLLDTQSVRGSINRKVEALQAKQKGVQAELRKFAN